MQKKKRRGDSPNHCRTTEQFKSDLEQINPTIEVLGEYTNVNTHIKVRCSVCNHVWSPTSHSLLRGSGCPSCAGNARKTTEQFISELKQINPTIEVLGEYAGSGHTILVRCSVCNHTWSPTPDSLLHGSGCPKCAGNARKTTESFKAELKKVNPTVEILGTYTGANKPIRVRCKVCDHTWSVVPRSLLQSRGCPKCAHKRRSSKISRPVRCVETGEVYPSITDAAAAVGLKNPSPISQVLNGRAKTAGGYHWEYADETDENSIKND